MIMLNGTDNNERDVMGDSQSPPMRRLLA